MTASSQLNIFNCPKGVPVRLGVLAAVEVLCGEIAVFDPSLYSGADCVQLAEALSKAGKACAGATARAAARAVSCGAHKQQGFADGADWLAHRSGSSMAEARSDLKTGRALENMPATSQALSNGELSLRQASEVVRAEEDAPGSEDKLVELAKRSGLGAVREEARKLSLGQGSPEQLLARQHAARTFRHWTDGLGMVCFSGALPPTVGVALVNRIEAHAVRLRRAAGTEGKREPFAAHAADALVEIMAGTGTGRASRADLVIVCDERAYRRGHAHPGEPCHIVGRGPVPISFARGAAAGAFLKAVVHDGVFISTVAHFGRHIPAELRTALELGPPPDFDGVSCTEPGCGRRYGLEWDHIDPVAHNGPTSYENIQAVCRRHHWQKTEQDRQAGLFQPEPP
jgi:hypothetical protein